MKNVTVIGAGTMGAGIAQVFAHKGHEVSLVDVSDTTLERGRSTIERSLSRFVKKEKCSESDKQATLTRIRYSTQLREAASVAELIVEAATEDLGLKQTLFRQIDEAAPASCLLATNTSSLSITKIAAVTRRPKQVIGMHFMNPVPMMRLVEIIRGYATSSTTADRIVSIVLSLEKTPVQVRDYPGFVANRILMPMINEAIYALHEGVADVKAIDEIMQLGMSHPIGPLRLADFIGLDVCLSILRVLYEGIGQPKYAPCPLLVKMVEAGYLGLKTSEGFYIYEQNKVTGISKRLLPLT